MGPGKSSFLSVADVVVGFEALETLRARDRMTPGTKVLLNEGRIMLSELSRRGSPYPPLGQIQAEIRAISPTVVTVDGPATVERVGLARTLNVVMLGALSGLEWLPCDETAMWEAVARRCAPRYLDANRRAFLLGRSVALGEIPGAGNSEAAGKVLKSP
jgi:indolepyruvate ferredoxin oxidoreductase beta subunit